MVPIDGASDHAVEVFVLATLLLPLLSVLHHARTPITRRKRPSLRNTVEKAFHSYETANVKELMDHRSR